MNKSFSFAVKSKFGAVLFEGHWTPKTGMVCPTVAKYKQRAQVQEAVDFLATGGYQGCTLANAWSVLKTGAFVPLPKVETLHEVVGYDA